MCDAEINAASSVSALALSSQFDLTTTYIMGSSIEYNPSLRYYDTA